MRRDNKSQAGFKKLLNAKLGSVCVTVNLSVSLTASSKNDMLSLSAWVLLHFAVGSLKAYSCGNSYRDQTWLQSVRREAATRCSSLYPVKSKPDEWALTNTGFPVKISGDSPTEGRSLPSSGNPDIGSAGSRPSGGSCWGWRHCREQRRKWITMRYLAASQFRVVCRGSGEQTNKLFTSLKFSCKTVKTGNILLAKTMSTNKQKNKNFRCFTWKWNSQLVNI